MEVNQALNDNPELINEDPHGQGWIVKIKIKDESELQKLMSATEYEKYIEGIEE
ncbi:MAG: hypothetical protein B5M54_08080 [Candidatus Aminicenantes bacterium 4484_214]|nr:MAG: hypothetical protein B5M54_08080 [Candidatus Aminicenantes bacterium 4484_214]